MSDLEESLVAELHALGETDFQREFRFHPTRRWRFDLAWPDLLVACEIEGGTWNGGRHTRGSGFEGDCEKYNEAALLGWSVLRVTSKMVKDGTARRNVRTLLRQRRDGQTWLTNDGD